MDLTVTHDPSNPNCPCGKDHGTVLQEIFPATQRARSCYNPTCDKMIGGGMGKWNLCSACRASSYCSSQCQKEDWSSHKAACKATVKERQRVEELRKTDPNLPEVHPAIPLKNAYLEVYIDITRLAFQFAGRSALRIDTEEDMADTHVLDILLEWRGTPSKVDFQDQKAVLQQLRLVQGRVVKADSMEAHAYQTFISLRENNRDQRGFCVSFSTQDTNKALIGGQTLYFVPYPLHSYLFRKRYQRALGIDLEWEKTLKNSLQPAARHWSLDQSRQMMTLIFEDLKKGERPIAETFYTHMGATFESWRHLNAWPAGE